MHTKQLEKFSIHDLHSKLGIKLHGRMADLEIVDSVDSSNIRKTLKCIILISMVKMMRQIGK